MSFSFSFVSTSTLLPKILLVLFLLWLSPPFALLCLIYYAIAWYRNKSSPPLTAETKTLLARASSVENFRNMGRKAQAKVLRIYAEDLQPRSTPVDTLVAQALSELDKTREPAQ